MPPYRVGVETDGGATPDGPGRRPTADDPRVDEPGEGRNVYWFVGGPLDGRVQTRAPSELAPATIRHEHLHDGPKIVHLYDLHEVAGHGGEYRLRVE